MKKQHVIKSLTDPGVVPVVRLNSGEKLPPLLEALADGGIRAVELTMTIPSATTLLRENCRRFEGTLLLGMGTVTDRAAAMASLEAGAQFLVSPFPVPEVLEEALSCPRRSVSLEVSTRNIMSVNVPVFTFQTDSGDDALLPYGFAQTSGELDAALEKMQAVFADMLELAQVEKTMQLLAQDIEKTRRRVNALEYVMIPETEQNIRYITMKLDENERGNTTRLMKVKEMVLQDAHHYQP